MIYRVPYCVTACVLFCACVAMAQDLTVPARLTLADALRLAEERNLALAAGREQVAVSQADAVTARQRLNPALAIESEALPIANRPNGFVNSQELFVRVDQEIETSGRRRLRREAAGLSIESARSVLEDARRRLRLAVQQRYLDVVLARAEAETARVSLEEIDHVIALNRARLQQGEISGGELRRLEVERLRFVDDVFAAELATKNARSALLALLHADRLDQPFEPTEVLQTAAGTVAPTIPALDVPMLRARALSNRPDLAAARRDEARSETDTRLQRALRVPNVTAGAGYMRDFGTNALVFNVTVPLPLFDRNAGGVARAVAERRLAATRVAAAETSVSLEVQQAVNGVEVSRARVDYLQNQYLKSARDARDVALAAYRSGAVSLLEYLDAQRAFRETQRTYNRALYEHRLNLFQLEAAVGSPADALPLRSSPGDIQP